MSSPPRQMHLLAFLLNTGGHIAGWRHPEAQAGDAFKLDYYKRLAQTAERGKFDALFLADAQGFRKVEGRDAYSRLDHIKLEPMTLLSALAVLTEKIGLIGTASTSYNEPYALARRFASLDHISEGRAGWNVVTSTSENEAHNFGRPEHFGHEERYRRAAEFVRVVEQLWDSWDDDAFVIDKAEGRYFDPDKVHGLNHKGEFFSVAGPLNIARPPQGHPVLVQAGASDTGKQFSAEIAEAIFTAHPLMATAQAHYAEMKKMVSACGRDPDKFIVLPAIQPVVAATEREAHEMNRELEEMIHPQLAVSMLQLLLGGFDLSPYPLDGPLPPIPETERAQSVRQRVVDLAAKENLSIRKVAQRLAAGRTSCTMSGTAEQVADQMEAWFAGRAGDGFMITPPFFPGGLEDFVDQVVPILQDRGLFRKEYEGTTLRDHLGLPRPPSLFLEHPERHHEPEIW